jgi:hypothetical protein
MRLTTIWTIRAMTLRERLHRTGEWALREMAYRMPRRLAYWSFIDTGARYTANDNLPIPEITYFTILERFGHDIDPVR